METQIKGYHFDESKHVHYFDDKPLMGTSTVVGVLNKPLNWWVAQETLYPLGWTKYNERTKDGGYKAVPKAKRLPAAMVALEAIKSLEAEEYLSFLDVCYKVHNAKKDKAADAGTERHAILETWIKECLKEHEGRPLALFSPKLPPEIQKFMFWAQINVKRFLWSELHGYSKELWTGGITDVGWEDYNDRVIAGDFKSSKDIYFSQYVQISGYDLMLSENGGYTADGKKIFTLERPIEAYCIIPFGNPDFKMIFVDQVQEWRAAFKSCVHLHYLTEQYNKILKQQQEQPKASVKEFEKGSLSDALAVLAKQ